MATLISISIQCSIVFSICAFSARILYLLESCFYIIISLCVRQHLWNSVLFDDSLWCHYSVHHLLFQNISIYYFLLWLFFPHQKEVSVAFCGCLYLYPLFACMYSPHKLYIYDKFIFVIIIVHVLFIHHFTKKKVCLQWNWHIKMYFFAIWQVLYQVVYYLKKFDYLIIFIYFIIIYWLQD